MILYSATQSIKNYLTSRAKRIEEKWKENKGQKERNQTQQRGNKREKERKREREREGRRAYVCMSRNLLHFAWRRLTCEDICLQSLWPKTVTIIKRFLTHHFLPPLLYLLQVMTTVLCMESIPGMRKMKPQSVAMQWVHQGPETENKLVLSPPWTALTEQCTITHRDQLLLNQWGA